MGVSGDTVRNYISLTNLVPELMQMVDEKKDCTFTRLSDCGSQAGGTADARHHNRL